LISPDVVKVAISKNIMFDVSKDGKKIVGIPIPESVKATGILPDGFAVGE
jgi:predicted peptidase